MTQAVPKHRELLSRAGSIVHRESPGFAERCIFGPESTRYELVMYFRGWAPSSRYPVPAADFAVYDVMVEEVSEEGLCLQVARGVLRGLLA